MPKDWIESKARHYTDEFKQKFVPYCTFGWHEGVIKEEFYKHCEARECIHYRKFILNYKSRQLEVKDEGRRTSSQLSAKCLETQDRPTRE